MIIHSPIISGSLTFANGGTFTLPDNGVFSGSFSGSVKVASIDSHLIPSQTNTFDLGSETKFWRDLYISTGSIKFVGSAGTVIGTLTNIGNGLNLDGGIVTNGNSTFGTSSLSNTTVTGSLLVNGNIRVINGGITGSIAATNGVVSGSSQIQFNTVNGTPFSQSADSVTTSKHIIPTTLTVDLGSATLPFRDLYLSSASLYIDGTQVLSSNATELIFSTDVGQSIKFNELGTDNIVLQTLDGDIELKSSGGGDITLDPTNGLIGIRGTLQIQDTHKITSSGGTKVVVGNDLEVTGSITSNSSITGTSFTGTINATNGVVSGSSQITYASVSSIPAGIVSGSTQVTPLLPTGTISGSSQVNLASVTGNSTTNVTEGTNLYFTDARVKTKLDAETVVSGSSQITYTSISSIPAGIVSGSSQVTPLLPVGVVSGSSQITYTSISSIPTGIVSGSSQLDGTNITNLTITNLTTVNQTASVIFSSGSNKFGDLSNDTHEFTGSVQISGSLTTIGASTATSFNGTINATNGVVSGSSQITYASISSIPAGIVSGSSQVTGIGNGQLTNSSTTIGTTAISLGASSTTLVGLTSVTSTAFVGALTGNASTVTTNANLTGDVTSVGNATTIGAAKVTNAMLAGSIDNNKLTNSTISGIALGSNLSTLTIGTGLSGTSYNGSGAVTIANTGVTSNVAGTGVTVSGATGAVTISIGQAVATSSNVQFNSLGVGMAASATAGRIDATNDVVAFSSSDIRFKENITPIENALDKISKINGYTYDWKEENKIEHGYDGNDVGVIAQEIEEILPQLVQTRESGFKAVKYDKLVALLIAGMKEQQLQIEELKSRLS